MNVVVSKLQLPCDLKNVIKSYIYNEFGFNVDQLNKIEKCKKDQEVVKLRQKFELCYWKNTGCSVSWLKPTPTTHSGAYLSKMHEYNNIIDLRSIVSQTKFVKVIDSLYHPVNNPKVSSLKWEGGNPIIVYPVWIENKINKL